MCFFSDHSTLSVISRCLGDQRAEKDVVAGNHLGLLIERMEKLKSGIGLKMFRWTRRTNVRIFCCLFRSLFKQGLVHKNRDQIMLNGEDIDMDDDGDEDEVFALNGIPESGSSSEDESAAELEKGESAKPDKTKPKPKGKKQAQVSDSDKESDSEEEEETWGSKKSAYYSTNAAHFDPEDEEANELEEQEAKRIQTKNRDVLADDDFGLEDHVEVVSQEDIR